MKKKRCKAIKLSGRRCEREALIMGYCTSHFRKYLCKGEK